MEKITTSGNWRQKIEDLAVSAKKTYEVQVAELSEGVVTRTNDIFWYNLEHMFNVDTVVAETTKGDYVLVIGQKLG